MFNPYDSLPNSVTVNAITYPVDMTYDNILTLYEMLADKTLSDTEQVLTGLELLLGELPDVEEDELAMIWQAIFMELLQSESSEAVAYDLKGNPMPKAHSTDAPSYDLFQDGEYIYASFMQDYGIDLVAEQGHLHWYQFRALLNGLSDDTKLRKVIEIRQMELPTGNDVQSEKQRSKIRELKRQFALKGYESDGEHHE